MPITTKHKYISKYPIKQSDESLILGTIHPHDIGIFKLEFFYGNKNSLWNILGQAKSLKLDNLENILIFLRNHKIAISDMILQCDRENPKITSDKDLYNIVLNENLKDEILNSQIKTIYFTSGFSKNNCAKLFFDLFKLKIPKNWKDNYEINIDFFGKNIKCVILLSPSGASNIGIVKSEIYLKNKEKYKSSKTPIKDFKIDFYKQKFTS
ncbi:hypothetical protein [Aliarcobacter butzleri]|uniref:hypothetical protein n=1 Tax=Aliarcobacter butzleri TaxID=28197 RepID=UPI0021B3E4C3|nr:hypothetical protein [Aliarcobacter butzleri]MCT7581266.1 hypothetical protein [Aliarcobacter butzleri]